MSEYKKWDKVIFAVSSVALIVAVIGCAQTLKPANELVYEGGLLGNEEFTYPSALQVREACLEAKVCMGLEFEDYPEPTIRGMKGGNAVWCGETLERSCYVDGVIIAPMGQGYDVISHACVHHWLAQSTGDADGLHRTEYFLQCGGKLKITED